MDLFHHHIIPAPSPFSLPYLGRGKISCKYNLLQPPASAWRVWQPNHKFRSTVTTEWTCNTFKATLQASQLPTRWSFKNSFRELPQQFPFAQDRVVDGVKGFETDFEVLDSHVCKLFCMSLLYPCNHCLEWKELCFVNWWTMLATAGVWQTTLKPPRSWAAPLCNNLDTTKRCLNLVHHQLGRGQDVIQCLSGVEPGMVQHAFDGQPLLRFDLQQPGRGIHQSIKRSLGCTTHGSMWAEHLAISKH